MADLDRALQYEPSVAYSGVKFQRYRLQMLTRVEIDGFKTFENFSLDLEPLTAIVGPNASGKSNLFDALRFISFLSQYDINTAMRGLRGEPEELFRRVPSGNSTSIAFAVEVLLNRQGIDSFGTKFETPAQRLRYEVRLDLSKNNDGTPKGVFVGHELCRVITRKEEKANFLRNAKLSYNPNASPFIRISESSDSISVRQDGRQKHGRPMQLSLKEASRTAVSTITTAEFPHLYALRGILTSIRFLEINPTAARGANDRFETRDLKADASNLAAVLARLKEETKDGNRPDGVLTDIASDLASLIPSVKRLDVRNDSSQRQYSFSLEFADKLIFSSRVISDGTLRLLALLTILDDPERRGTLCFEEPENGVHEGRVAMLIKFLRQSTELPGDAETPAFQILLNTHSPKVMHALKDHEIVAADTVATTNPNRKTRISKTRMRRFVVDQDLLNIDYERHLTRIEVEKLLQLHADAA